MMRRYGFGLGVAAALGLAVAGCGTTGGTTGMNAIAQQKGPAQVALVQTGIGVGVVQIRMADGEVLNGQYSMATASVGPAGEITSVADIPIRFFASGPSTTLTCRGVRTLGGNGNAQCTSQNGGVWTVNW